MWIDIKERWRTGRINPDAAIGLVMMVVSAAGIVTLIFWAVEAVIG